MITKRISGVLVWLGAGLLVLAGASSATDLRLAFLDREKYELAEVKAYYSMLGGEQAILAEKWKNYQDQARSCPAVAEVVKVRVAKTTDSGEYVITLMGPTGKTCSLWVKGSRERVELPVRDFSPY